MDHDNRSRHRQAGPSGPRVDAGQVVSDAGTKSTFDLAVI
jgi:hypothetical protein